jgi:tetratricopeptide (TPR) repeat protein
MADIDAGRTLGDFEIVRELGRGGMGVVYEARQVSLNRKVALKVLASGLGLTARAVERFRREAEAAAQLHHTNIVPVYATGEQDGVHFYAMELIEGPPLNHVIRQLRVPNQATPSPDSAVTGLYVQNAGSSGSSGSTQCYTASIQGGAGYFDTVARVTAEVADALDYAHKQGVVHRDVKPSNLLLSPEGRLSLNDFGLARLLEQPGMTITGEFVGTPAYMSPEQISSGRIPLDHRTDIYSLGATLYELLTLQRPFKGERRDQVLAQIIEKEPIPPRRLNKHVPRDLETICLKSMEKIPAKRYQTAGHMAEDLRRFVNRFAISAKRAGPVARLHKWVRRHPALAGALVVAVLALAAAGGFAYRAHTAEQAHLAEKRQNALDRAALAARSGDLDEAEQAIQEAERLGASAGQVRMLYGQVALYSGQSEKAVNHLEQATTLLPDSVAARALLADAYAAQFRWDAFAKTLAVARDLKASTPDDFYYLGVAEANSDPEKGLHLMEEAVRRRPSPLVRLDRASALSTLAEIKGNPSYGEQAIQDAERVVHDDLPDNPFAQSTLLWAYVETANAYLIDNRPEKAIETLELATPVFHHLGKDRFRSDPSICSARKNYYQLRGDQDGLLAEQRQNPHQLEHPLSTYEYAIALYRLGLTREALAATESQRGQIDNDLFRCLLLAEVDGHTGRALALCREIANRDLQGREFLHCQGMLRLLGAKDETLTACRNRAARPDRCLALSMTSSPLTCQCLMEYLGGEADEKQLLAAAADSLWDQCNAHFFIAAAKISEGRPLEAHDHFRHCAATRAINVMLYHVCDAILARIAQDPSWPKWMPSDQ